MGSESLNVVMFPWFSFGHFIPFLHLANRLAERGHTTTLLLPPKAKSQLENSNLHPTLITLHPITIPHVDPLPPGSYETTSDLPFHLQTHLATAMDRTRPQFHSIVAALRPNLLFYDLAHWVPQVGSALGIKSVAYMVVSSAAMAFGSISTQLRAQYPDWPITEDDVARVLPPPGYPSSTLVASRAWKMSSPFPFGEGITFQDRISATMKDGDAIACRTCREIEPRFCDYFDTQLNKPFLLSGPALPDPGPRNPEEKLEGRWAEWLAQFNPGTVVFCSFGSQFVLEKAQFQEMLLGFEMTKLPFLLALRPPAGCATVNDGFPEGFEGRVGDRGVVYGGWVPQQQIMSHPSVGCFVSHGGPGTMWEALLSDKQMVFIPQLGDQVINAKLMAAELKVGVEVEKGEEGWVGKEGLCKAVKSVMDEDSEIRGLVKKNHGIWREKLVTPGFMSGYIDRFIKDLQQLLG